MPSDTAIINEVRTALDRDPRLAHPGEVAVAEQNGTVTLRGSVASPRQRRAAVEITRSVHGVSEVVDDLSVDLLDRWQDDEIRGSALQALMTDVGVPAGRIDVSVADGWLTLNGEVKRQSESDAAFNAVSGLPGVGGITNKIQVITAGIDG